MKIVLRKLSLLNFKGIRSLEISFNDVTNIYGDNKTGKTTIFDSYLWLLFGKDSTDRKDFEIKTLDKDNKPFHRMDHEVSATINVDGEDIYLKRVYKEKWEKPRGQLNQVFKGHTNDFFWNEVPLKESEFQAKVSGLVNENVFKLISNTSYFNSRPWQERRSVLLQIAGEISNTEIFDSLITVSNKDQFIALQNALNGKKTVEEFKKEIVGKKKKINDELDLIPVRISEANRSLPDLLNYVELENSLTAFQSELSDVETQLLNKTKAQQLRQEEINKKLTEIQELRMKIQQIEFSEKNKVQDSKRTREQSIIDLKRDLKNKLEDVQRNAIEITNNTSRKKSLELKQQELRNKWSSKNEEKLEFKENEFSCPACKRAYEATDIEAKKTELTNNFNLAKSAALTDITNEGKKLTEDISKIDTLLGGYKSKDQILQSEITALQEKISTAEQQNTLLSANESEEVEKSITGNTEHKSISEKITLLNEEVNTPQPADSMQSELLSKKKDITEKIDAVKKDLSSKEQREKTEKRIEELKAQETEMGNELSRLEGIEFSILQFEKAKMDELETRVNSRFEIVKFKLFEQQINEGEKPNCITLIDGVPYSDANYASRIQAGLDIINTLTKHYNVTAPVFIDNRESVVTLPESDSQIINLRVSESDKKLRVDTKKPALANMA